MNKQIDYFDKAYECIFTKEYSDEQTIEYFLENQIISDGNDIINIIKILRPIKRASSQAFKAIIFGIVLQIPLLILFASSNRIALGACCIGLASIIIGIKKKYRIRRILKQIRFSLKDGHIEPLSYYIPKKKLLENRTYHFVTYIKPINLHILFLLSCRNRLDINHADFYCTNC